MDILIKNVVLIGDKDCGKWQLMNAITKNKQFIAGTVPHWYEMCNTCFEFNGNLMIVSIWNIDAWIDHNCVFRPNIDAVLICYSIGSEVSLTNVIHKWTPMAKKLFPKVPIVLVANKKDLRTFSTLDVKKLFQREETPIEFWKGLSVAQLINAFYCECSAKTKEGVPKVLETAIRASLEKKS